MASMSDADDETEEILLFAEIDGLLCTEILEHDSICVPTFKIVGLDTDKPYMQIGKETFEGEYQDRIGSALFFEKDPHPSGDDPTFRKVPENPLRYFGKTDKNLCLNRVFLKSKKEPEQKEVAQPLYIDSKDIEALAATEKEYFEKLENFKETNVAEEILADLQGDNQNTENQEGKEVSVEQTVVVESTKDLLPSSSSKPDFASASKPATDSAVSIDATSDVPVSETSAIPVRDKSAEPVNATSDVPISETSAMPVQDKSAEPVNATSDVPIRDASAVAEVSQLVCEQMDIDNDDNLQTPPT